MSALAEGAGLESALWQLYRQYYDSAEATRRWSISEDIPWSEARLAGDADLVEMIESLLAVKLKVVDMSSKIIPRVRGSFGRTWFYATWGYEELRHNLVLSDWLLASKHHTQEKLMALEDAAIAQEWHLPCDDLPGLLAYAVVQEAAAVEWIAKLRDVAQNSGADAAILRVLEYVLADDRAHYDFFRDCLRMQMKFEPDGVPEKVQWALERFSLPALGGMPGGSRRLGTLARRGILTSEIFTARVARPILDVLADKMAVPVLVGR